jgi:hypothetical protein
MGRSVVKLVSGSLVAVVALVDAGLAAAAALSLAAPERVRFRRLGGTIRP